MSSKSDPLSVLTALGRMKREINRIATQKLKTFGIGPKQGVLIRELSGVKCASLAELSRATYSDPTATGRAFAPLIKKGIVDQKDHPKDRRRYEVALSAKGVKVAAEIQKVYLEIARVLCKPLTDSERANLVKTVEKITANLKKQEAGEVS